MQVTRRWLNWEGESVAVHLAMLVQQLDTCADPRNGDLGEARTSSPQITSRAAA